MPKRMTPDMTGKASEITDPILLFARIGYRTYLAWRDGDQSPSTLYTGSIWRSCGACGSWPKEATDQPPAIGSRSQIRARRPTEIALTRLAWHP